MKNVPSLAMTVPSPVKSVTSPVFERTVTPAATKITIIVIAADIKTATAMTTGTAIIMTDLTGAMIKMDVEGVETREVVEGAGIKMDLEDVTDLMAREAVGIKMALEVVGIKMALMDADLGVRVDVGTKTDVIDPTDKMEVEVVVDVEDAMARIVKTTKEITYCYVITPWLIG